MDYWREAFLTALEEAEIPFPSDEKIALGVKVLEGAFENYGMSHGHDCIPDPRIAERTEEKRNKERALAEEESRTELYRRAFAAKLGVEANRLYINNGDIFISRT